MPLPVETVKEKFGLIAVEVTVVKCGVIEVYTAVVMGQRNADYAVTLHCDGIATARREQLLVGRHIFHTYASPPVGLDISGSEYGEPSRSPEYELAVSKGHGTLGRVGVAYDAIVAIVRYETSRAWVKSHQSAQGSYP